jgi:hypothetical protein
MSGRGRLVAAIALSMAAISSHTLAAYAYSVYGGWRTPAVILPLYGSLAAGLLASSCAGTVIGRRSGLLPVLRATVLVVAGSCTLAAGLFFAVLTNCRLTCDGKVRVASESPDGRWTALWSEESCTAIAIYCLAVTRVSLVPNGEPGSKQVEVFRVRGASRLWLRWQSNDLLTIVYDRGIVLERPQSAGNVRIEAMTVGIDITAP